MKTIIRNAAIAMVAAWLGMGLLPSASAVTGVQQAGLIHFIHDQKMVQNIRHQYSSSTNTATVRWEYHVTPKCYLQNCPIIAGWGVQAWPRGSSQRKPVGKWYTSHTTTRHHVLTFKPHKNGWWEYAVVARIKWAGYRFDIPIRSFDSVYATLPVTKSTEGSSPQGSTDVDNTLGKMSVEELLNLIGKMQAKIDALELALSKMRPQNVRADNGSSGTTFDPSEGEGNGDETLFWNDKINTTYLSQRRHPDHPNKIQFRLRRHNDQAGEDALFTMPNISNLVFIPSVLMIKGERWGEWHSVHVIKTADEHGSFGSEYLRITDDNGRQVKSTFISTSAIPKLGSASLDIPASADIYTATTRSDGAGAASATSKMYVPGHKSSSFTTSVIIRCNPKPNTDESCDVIYARCTINPSSDYNGMLRPFQGGGSLINVGSDGTAILTGGNFKEWGIHGDTRVSMAGSVEGVADDRPSISDYYEDTFECDFTATADITIDIINEATSN